MVVWGIHGAVETGLVRSLARTGGNWTGIESLAPHLDAKRLELIMQIVPKLARLGVIYNADDQGAPVHLISVRDAARILGVGLAPLPVRRPDDFDGVLSRAALGSVDGLLIFTDDLTATHWDDRKWPGTADRERRLPGAQFGRQLSGGKFDGVTVSGRPIAVGGGFFSERPVYFGT